ncbi:hypothetical protein KRMM14A1004_29380 [Krasilnikovia sp. MM14-A1004]
MIAALLSAVTAAPAQAISRDSRVKTLVIAANAGDSFHSTLRLNFDSPISQQQAAAITSAMAGPTVTPTGESMWCLGYISRNDANSTFYIQYNCGSPRTLTWGWKLSASLQSVIVSSVSEIGLQWWRNGAFAGQNAPHVVPKDYTIHGTMNPVYAGNDIDYQDYATFRHNVGTGGTGSVSWAGSVILRN